MLLLFQSQFCQQDKINRKGFYKIKHFKPLDKKITIKSDAIHQRLCYEKKKH